MTEKGSNPMSYTLDRILDTLRAWCRPTCWYRRWQAIALLVFAVIATQWATAPEGAAQIGGQRGSRIIKAGAFLLEDEKGEVVGGLTTGVEELDFQYPYSRYPRLFLRQDSVRVSLSATKYGHASIVVAHEAGQEVSIEVDLPGAFVEVKDGRSKAKVMMGAKGDAEADVYIYSPNLRYDRHKVGTDIEALQRR